MDRSSVTKQFVRTVGTFAFVGPPVGVAMMWIGLIAEEMWAGKLSDVTGPHLIGLVVILISALPVSLVIGYVVGVIPAAVVGVVCHFFARAVRTDAVWIVLCTVAGAVGGMLTTAVLDRGWPDGISLAWSAATGGVAAAVCGLQLRKARWT